MTTTDDLLDDYLSTATDGLYEVPADSLEPGAHLALSNSKTMVVVRESNMYDLLAFATMIRQVLELLVGRVPGVELVLELTGTEAEVMRNDSRGAALRSWLNARALYQGTRPYGWVFEVEGTIFLFAMTSAFSDAAEDLRNNFTTDLIDELTTHRPDALVTGPSTRLVRRKDLGEMLGRHAGLLRIRIFTKETPEGLDLNTTTGSTNWTLLGLLAEQDLRYTVMRLLTGRIHHVRSGGWLAGLGALPLGFTIDDPDTKKPEVGSEPQVRQARLLLGLAAQAGAELDLAEAKRTLNPETIIAKLSAGGVRKRSNKKTNRRGEPVAGAALDTVTAPKTALLSLLSVLDAYSETGDIKRLQQLPMTGLTQHDVHGNSVYKKDPTNGEEKGHICFKWCFPKPVNDKGKEVPWATAKVLAGARTYYEHLQTETGPGTPSTQNWPLVGLFSGTSAGQSYRLSYGSRGYQWKREDTAVGKFNAALTTTRFVDTVIDTLDRLGIDPTDVRLAGSQRSVVVGTVELKNLEGRKGELENDFRSACAAVRDAKEGSRQRTDHQAVADGLEAQLDQIEDDISALTVGESVEEPDDLVVGDLATLLSILLDTAGEPVDPFICVQLGRIVTRGTIDDCWVDSSPWATFRATLSIPTERSFTRAIDISFEVGNTSQGPDRQAFWQRRMPKLLEMRMTTGISIEEFAERLGAQPSPLRVGGNLQDALQPMFEWRGMPTDAASTAATAIIDCPILSTRAIVWALLKDLPLPETVEDLDATETSRHIEDLRDHYLSPHFGWKAAAWSTGGERLRREVARWVRANSSAEDPALGASAVGLTEACGLANISALTPLLWKEHSTADGSARVLERTQLWPSGAFKNPHTGERMDSVPDDAKRVKLRSCPHCNHSGLHPVSCVEFGDDPVVCPSCQLHPWDPTLKRPRSYLENFEGPWGRTATDDRDTKAPGTRTGTIVGPSPAMPTPTRIRRAKRKRAPKATSAKTTVERLCVWPCCTNPVPEQQGKGRPRLYCGQEGHTSRAMVQAQQRTKTSG